MRRVTHKIAQLRRIRRPHHNGSGKLTKLGHGLSKMYPSRSIHFIKERPLKMLGFVAMGVSAISGLIIWNRFRNR
jgi:hypothetical protein